MNQHGTTEEQAEQGLLPLEVARAAVRSAPAPQQRPPVTPAATDPVARVLVDVPLAHLDRPFDYLVTDAQDTDAVPGARVKVRFAGKDVDGFIVERVAESDHRGRLQPLRRVVSPEPVLSAEVAELSGAIARRCAGTRSDVLRLAVPPRHATTEKRPSEPAPPLAAEPHPASWAHLGGADELSALAAGESPRLVVGVPPGDDGLALIVEAVVATVVSGRGAVVCVPDARDLARLDALLAERLGAGQHAVLAADLGPAKRYAAFLAVLRGAVRIAIGTRAAAFAPVRDLGLVAVWDDGDDLYDEPRAPYPHTRDVLLERARATGCAALLAGHARSVEAHYLVRTGWARELAATRDELRRRIRVAVTGDSDHDLERDPFARQSRMPREVHEVIAHGLAEGPVLVQTPRAGYATRLACDTCRAPSRCPSCAGPLQIRSAHAPPVCDWCARVADAWTCSECGGRGLRAPVLGDRRTAEELGRAFPGTTVRSSAGERISSSVPAAPAIVVATPGAEPFVDGGYAAAVLLDTWLFLARADLRAAEEAVRRWCNAAALVRPGGRALLVGAPEHPALQALVRWDPAGFAERETVERQSAHLPPASRVATVTGDKELVEGALETARESGALPPGTEVLGPVVVDEEEVRYVVRAPRAHGAALADAFRTLQAQRSARKLPHLRVVLDPVTLG